MTYAEQIHLARALLDLRALMTRDPVLARVTIDRCVALLQKPKFGQVGDG